VNDELYPVRDEWRRRVIAEYRSAAITCSLLGWLMQLGASPTLLHEATRIIDDELVHAEHAFAVLEAAGGGEVELATSVGLRLEPGLSLLENVAVHGTRVFCLGETAAVRLFKRLREGATVDVARRALDRVLLDEVRHRDFGWLLLEWLASRVEWEELSRLLNARLPQFLAELREGYGVADAPFDPALRAWGLMPNRDYREALEETLARDLGPRLAQYELTFVNQGQGDENER
jgi:hypothetical protein